MLVFQLDEFYIHIYICIYMIMYEYSQSRRYSEVHLIIRISMLHLQLIKLAKKSETKQESEMKTGESTLRAGFILN